MKSSELSFYEWLQFSTTRLETSSKTGQVKYGTGFFYNLQLPEQENKVVPIIVTNKHVVDGMDKLVFHFSPADENGNPTYGKPINIALDIAGGINVVYHPDSSVDLCAIPYNIILNILRSKSIHTFHSCLDSSFIPSASVKNELDALEDILMVGYPIALWDETNNMPLFRRGITATHPRLDYNGKKEFLIDAACFPGSSGSPVLICDVGSYTDKRGNISMGANRIILLGVLYAGPQHSVEGELKIVSIPTTQSKISPVASIPTNLGYVIKAERIEELLAPLRQAYSL